DCDAPAQGAAKQVPVWSNHQSLSLAPQEDDQTVIARAACGSPCTPGMLLDLLSEGFKLICSQSLIKRQRLDMANRLTQHLGSWSRLQLRHRRTVRHERPYLTSLLFSRPVSAYLDSPQQIRIVPHQW